MLLLTQARQGFVTMIAVVGQPVSHGSSGCN